MSELTFDDKKERAVILGEYIVEKKATVRAAAKAFGISKSTVHGRDKTENIMTGLFIIIR